MEQEVRPKRQGRRGDDGGDEIVSGSALARHLDCSRGYIDQLEAAGVFHRASAGGGFNLSAARVGYIRHLRTAKSRSPKSEAEEAFLREKTKALEVRTAQRLGELVPSVLFDEMIDALAGMYRTELAVLPAAFTRDIRERRRLEGLIHALLKRVANEAFRRAERVEAAEGDGSEEALEEVTDDAD